MTARAIYLDYNASTPVDPRVAAAMRPFLEDAFGNPSSPHWAGSPAKAALERARGQVADLLGCAADEVVFTSGGSEANNLALKGVFFALRDRGDHLVTTAVEHPAVLAPLRFLETLSARVTVLPVDGTGRVDPAAVERAITPRTILVSVMHANNEVGTVPPVKDTRDALGLRRHQIGRRQHLALQRDAAAEPGGNAEQGNEGCFRFHRSPGRRMAMASAATRMRSGFRGAREGCAPA